MEVHHHSHTSRKKWTHYFWEFLMLFLAVFCGFLAEYQLEHKIEKDRSKQYIHSLFEDLKADTARINYLLEYDDEKITALNTMMSCYDTVQKNLKSTSCMGLLIKHSKTNRAFQITDRTLRQLANAGGFRLLKKEDADSLLSYEALFNAYKNFESTVYQTSQDNVRNTLNELAEFKVNAPLQTSTAIGQGADTTSDKLSGPLLFSDDRRLLNKWFNELLVYRRVMVGQRNTLNQLLHKASGLIEYYRTKHHLE